VVEQIVTPRNFIVNEFLAIDIKVLNREGDRLNYHPLPCERLNWHMPLKPMRRQEIYMKYNNNGYTPLHAACINGNIDIVNSLLKCNSSVNLFDINILLYILLVQMVIQMLYRRVPI
jgi:hypothetical protein